MCFGAAAKSPRPCWQPRTEHGCFAHADSAQAARLLAGWGARGLPPYCLSKRLAEELAASCHGRPARVAIVRPSIVGATLAGYVGNTSGMTGAALAYGTGAARSCGPWCCANALPGRGGCMRIYGAAEGGSLACVTEHALRARVQCTGAPLSPDSCALPSPIKPGLCRHRHIHVSRAHERAGPHARRPRRSGRAGSRRCAHAGPATACGSTATSLHA